ncbi:hypothetical protein BVG16_05170 [Paenibacillus selenitireducens]|uniref:Uncharacterized protein n=1 Tax=Paenibacillus selenitireducens TaxID=1324314 RepID=A0A1T2XJY9_9BACL|nr:DUF5682 family protein [Paenibacillus selenitireducens]OPA80138.1 hypothetical protein BVG16_05170 [Paenibacillus selenitireducens]
MNSVATAAVHIFGVRHLSPGGSLHLLEMLREVQPTAVLIEGPSDANSEMHHLTNRLTNPPVAILAFTEDLPVRTVLWPFAAYSPEYQAMKWAAENGAHAAFIDLPSSITVALQHLRVDPGEKEVEEDADTASKMSADAFDDSSIYARIAAIAGEHDYDMYWERNYELNRSKGAYKEAIIAFSTQMRELTEENERQHQRIEYAYNAIREAYMRRQIQDTIAAGHEPNRIVVVCGAYHAAALAQDSRVMTDQEWALLPSRKTKLTLMPYSYYKLSSMSGYGAGNNAPNYYEMMWERMRTNTLEDLPHYYLSSIARWMRETGNHRSTAEVIEAVRLAEALAALHGGASPTLRDLRDAAQTLLGRGDLSVIADALARVDVGTAIGSLAEGVSQTPIQDDLNRLLKQLKLEKYKTTVATDLSLDLRENRRVASEESAFLDLNRSTLFHRLVWLGISFAKIRPSGQEQATWAEHWVIQWSPEVEIQVVESTLLGETVEVASAYVLQQKLEGCSTIAEASMLIRTACDCRMLEQMETARQTLQRLAADSRDVVQIAAAAKELSMIISYGDLRRMETTRLLPLLEQLFMRACLFLLDAAQCNDEAASDIMAAMNELNRIALEHSEQVDESLWLQELLHLSERDDRNPRLSGFACAILMERHAITHQQCAEEVSRRLSPGIPADLGAGWFEGLSQRNRYALLSRQSLWEQLNAYIVSLSDDEFARALVFLRRAFSSFAPREKTMIAELLGELWGVHTDQAAEILTGDLKEDEVKMIDELNEFDFEDF